MTTYYLKARKTLPLQYLTVDANTREEAISQVATSAAVGEQIEVLECTDSPAADVPPAGGATGATGTSRRG
jgi:hypothetical protein